MSEVKESVSNEGTPQKRNAAKTILWMSPITLPSMVGNSNDTMENISYCWIKRESWNMSRSMADLGWKHEDLKEESN